MMGMGRGKVIYRSIGYSGYEVTGDEKAFADMMEGIYDKFRGLTAAKAADTVERLEEFGIDVENFDPNSPSNKVLVSVVTDLMEATVMVLPDFNAVALVEALVRSDDAYGSYNESLRKITINININKNRNEFLSGKSTTCTQVGTIAHEFGHAVRSYLRNTQKKTLNEFEMATISMRPLSIAGTTNSSESFAESFAAYVTGSPRTNSYHRAFEDLMLETGLYSLKNVLIN